MADYAISNVPRRVVYAASGVGPYAFTFEILTASDIAVYKASTLLTLTTDYTVTINANGTGSVTLVATAGTSNITIVGAKNIQRTTDFTTGGDFFANTLNDELDAQTIFIQQVAETAERGLKAPVTDPTDINMTLPTKTSRAGKTLAFDSNGNPVVGEDIGNWRGDWAAGTAYSVRDLVRDASNQNVYRCNTAHTSTGTTPLSSNVDIGKWDVVIAVSDLSSLVDDAEAAADAAEAAQAAAEAAQAAAETAETNAETAETNAETAASAASTSATNAASSASTASTQATNAGNSATAAASSASAASTSATNASNSASAASTSASNASSSASAAATSETNAASSASAASTSASNASSSASAASTSATNAASSATAAQTAQAAAEAALDGFTDIYLGAFSSDPTLDNDGNALTAGDLYFNTVSNRVKVYSGSAWGFVSVDPALVVEKTSDIGSAKIPNGTTAERDGSPATGFFRFNSSLSKFEGYNGSAWGSVGGGATGGGSDDIFIENGQTVTTNYTLTTGKNALSAGPISIASGVTVTVPSGQVWSII
jgi:hypothetical protein